MPNHIETALNAMKISLRELKDLNDEASLLDTYGQFEKDCILQTNKLLEDAILLMENLSVEAQIFYEK